MEFIDSNVVHSLIDFYILLPRPPWLLHTNVLLLQKKTFSEILMWCLELGRFTCKFLSVELISNAFLARHRELNLHLVDFICYVRKFSAAGNLLNEKMTYKKTMNAMFQAFQVWKYEDKSVNMRRRMWNRKMA